MAKSPIKTTDRDFERMSEMLVDYPHGRRAVDISKALGIGAQRVAERLTHGRKKGLFIVSHVGFSVMWYSSTHANIVREKQLAALALEVERRRARTRSNAEAKRAAKIDEQDIDLLPVRRVIGRGWEGVSVAPGVVSVFALGDRALSNC